MGLRKCGYRGTRWWWVLRDLIAVGKGIIKDKSDVTSLGELKTDGVINQASRAAGRTV